jgi:hypothetical protein
MSARGDGRTWIIGIACLVAAGAVGVALLVGGSSGDSDGASTVRSGGTTRAAGGEGSVAPRSHRSGEHHHSENPNAGPYPDISPAKLVGGNSGPFSSEILWPDTSGWKVTSYAQSTWITAGAEADHPSVGLFGVIRSNPIRDTDTTDFVKVPGAGPVTITKAPLGRKVVVSAQKHGDIEFTSKSGITGTLHLKDDTVTLNTP